MSQTRYLVSKVKDPDLRAALAALWAAIEQLQRQIDALNAQQA